MNIRRVLIKKLGGYTKEEYDLLKTTCILSIREYKFKLYEEYENIINKRSYNNEKD